MSIDDEIITLAHYVRAPHKALSQHHVISQVMKCIPTEACLLAPIGTCLSRSAHNPDPTPFTSTIQCYHMHWCYSRTMLLSSMLHLKCSMPKMCLSSYNASLFLWILPIVSRVDWTDVNTVEPRLSDQLSIMSAAKKHKRVVLSLEQKLEVGIANNCSISEHSHGHFGSHSISTTTGIQCCLEA